MIDLELLVQEDSKPGDRVVNGLQTRRLGLKEPENYGRAIAPAMLSDRQPHDPFKVDIFQMGKMFYIHFYVLRDVAPAAGRHFRKDDDGRPQF